MIPYCLHTAITITVCLAFYKLLLQKETYYRLNRMILLTCLVLAFVLPLVPVPGKFSLVNSEWRVVSSDQSLVGSRQFPVGSNQLSVGAENESDVENTAAPISTSPTMPLVAKRAAIAPATKPLAPTLQFIPIVIKWAFILYWCGVAAFGANLLLQVVVLLAQAYKKPVIHDGIYRIVELDGDKAPCSFGNNIFINPGKYDWDTYNQILLHEKVHIQQGHSFDLVLAELMLVLQWFNPFAWLYRKELESNLEFLTDSSVLEHHAVAAADYQLSLLKVSVPNFSMRITTNYNQSLLKKRIIMMNAKKSNIHTMWKYFMLAPLLLVLVCGLNKPIAVGSPVMLQQQGPMKVEGRKMDVDFSHGTWFATLRDDKINIEFKADDNDENHNWSSSHTFKLSDFPTLPKGDKADFTLTREAGTVVFNGKFDGDQGYGHYKFKANKDYAAFMAKQDISGLDDDEYFSFFMADVTKAYVAFLKKNGFSDISLGQIMSMAALKIDAAYIKYWKSLGYNEVSPNELVSLKSLKVDSAYVNDIRRAGYTDLTIRELISFKAQHITGDYINGLRKATIKVPAGTPPPEKPSPREIMSSKAMNIDSAYVNGIRQAGYPDIQYQQMASLKSMRVTPEYIKSFEAVGYTDIPYHVLIDMKSQGITPEYVKAFKDLGYTNDDLPRLIQLKRQGITPEYVKSFQAVGYKNIPVNELSRLRTATFKTTLYNSNGTASNATTITNSSGLYTDGNTFSTAAGQHKEVITAVTPEYIKGFQDIGYKDLPFNDFYNLNSMGITPEFIKGFQAVGYKDIPMNNLYTLKSLTPEYIKSFQDIGYKDVTLMQYSSLKRQGVTADFVAGFNKLGFNNIPVNQLAYIKMTGVTPEFVADMKQKGFDSKDLQKYVQLKNFNSNNNTLNERTIQGTKMARPLMSTGQQSNN